MWRIRGTALVAVVLIGSACGSDETEDTAPFCAALAAASGPTGSVRSVDLDAASSVEVAADALSVLVADAPEEIRDDATTVAEVYRQVIEALSTAPAPARDDVLVELQPLLDEAREPTARFNAYAERTCGISLDAPQEAVPTPTPVTSDSTGIEG
jgi:hypothetical protein